MKTIATTSQKASVRESDRYGDLDGALRTAMKGINKATISAQEIEGIADDGVVPMEADFRSLYRALRLAREHVKLVLRTYLKDLRSQDEREGRRSPERVNAQGGAA
jgi:hypothetical protein